MAAHIAGEVNLVASLVDRLSTRLPHRTGSNSHDLHRDDLVALTRSTLIDISITTIPGVIDALLQLLEDLSHQYGSVETHPIHVLRSELYIIHLVADCCSAHWASLRSSVSDDGSDDDNEFMSQSSLSDEASRNTKSSDGADQIKRKPRRTSKNSQDQPANLKPLESTLVGRLLVVMKGFLSPIDEQYILPASIILDDHTSVWDHNIAQKLSTETSQNAGLLDAENVKSFLSQKADEIDRHVKAVIEFISASNWTLILENLQSTLRTLRNGYLPQPSSQQLGSTLEDDRQALINLRLIAFYSVDARRLSLVISELCATFLHLRKVFQSTVSVVLPLLINRWLEQNPEEFVGMHITHTKLESGPDTLFDMANTVPDAARWRSRLWPMQLSLLFLLPEVYLSAAYDQPPSGSGMTKKVAFLENLRKGLRNRNSTAAYCLISILRAARHFSLNSDAALLSFAMDIQDEVREAIFRKFPTGIEYTVFEDNLISAAFVSLTHLNFEKCDGTLAPLCLAANSPKDFKLGFVSACCYLAKQKNAKSYEPLFTKLSTFIRSHLKGLFVNTKASNAGEQYPVLIPTAVSTSADLTYRILTFLDIQPITLFEGAPADPDEYDAFFQENLASIIACLAADDEGIRYLTSSIVRKLMADGSIFLLPKNSIESGWDAFHVNFWRSTSIILLTISDKLVEIGDHGNSMLTFVHDYLESRVLLLRSSEVRRLILKSRSTDATNQEIASSEVDVPECVAASGKLETMLLVSLCSADIETCQLVTSCIALLCEETEIVEKISESSKQPLPIAKNIEIYKELSSRDFRFTGLVAFQKRVRSLLRRIAHPSSGILRAWEIVFGKWAELSKRISTSRAAENLEERSLVEWRNCSGFLASLAGSCVSTQISTSEDSGFSGLKWIDKPWQENQEECLLDRYLTQSVQLLAFNNLRIREGTREVLSTELSASLYLPLFKILESELEGLFDGPSRSVPRIPDATINFADQAAALLKTIVDRLGNPTEIGAALSIDIGGLTLNFAKFLNGLTEGNPVLIMKIKVCQLCEVITRKKELLNLRHDVRIRNQLLEIMFMWIARPGSPRFDSNSLSDGSRTDDPQRLQRDLDRACLKALSDLTYRLPLQPPEGQSDADTSDLKSQMFHSYFNRFLSLLNFETICIVRHDGQTIIQREDTIPTSDLAILALSNLLSANIDVGLKHSLGIGYHEDLEVRTAFVKVLCNVLAQGTEFNNLSDGSVNEKYDELVKLLVGDLELTVALCDACPSSEVEELAISLLNIFDSRHLSSQLLQALIENEVAETENESELLRRNCVATKILSIFAKWKGSSYLKSTLQNVLERLILTAQALDLELDPARTNSPEELQKNARQLRVVTKVFIDDICNSAPNIPVVFRDICNIISSSVMARFPDAKFTAVGAFIFLRFFCPAIVAPDIEGLINTAPSKEMRRGLLLIAKIIQNLANNVLFGAKESYMFQLNDFLTQNIYKVTTFLREISVAPASQNFGPETESFDFGSSVALHRFLYDHWDHVRQKIQSRQRKGALHSPQHSQVPPPAVESLRSLITNLGPPPMDISWNRPTVSMNSPPSYSQFQHFMLRNAGRSAESIISTRAIYDGGESKDGLSMICVILRNIDVDASDCDLLLYCYLKIASRMWHRPFGILIDATCYSGQNEPEDAVFRKLDLLTPSELSKNLSRVYVYNMNSAFRKCFRRILRLSAKSEKSAFHPKNVDYHLLGSNSDLQSHFHLSQLHLPKDTISIVSDTRYVFQPITRLSKTKGKIDVVIMVGSQYVQVTTTKKQEVVPGLRLHATVNDIFRLTEIDEAPTSIQTEDDTAFGLRTESGKIVMYFTSPRKADVLQTIRGAKTKYGKDLKPTASFERLIRPQDVPGTLLNISLTNIASLDQKLRLASYNLLCALCQNFKFGINAKFMTSNELCVPLNASHFIVDVSRQLALSEPQLTADFLNGFFVGWDSFPLHQRPLSLAYMAPWLPGLRTHVLAIEGDGEKSREKIAVIFRKLLDVALSDPSLCMSLENNIWPTVCTDEVQTEILLEEIVKSALVFGADDERIDVLGSIIISMQVVSIRGRLLSKLRKALNRTSQRPMKYLPDNNVWDEICVLLRLCLSTSFDSGVQSQLYLPELFHIVTMLANTGSADIRMVVHQLLVNTIHALGTNFLLEESKLARLRIILSSLSESGNEHQSNILGSADAFKSHMHEAGGFALISTEDLASRLSEISVIAAPSVDLSNAWRSRWMSLVASTAFQSNPAIQPRAFAVMGCLAREDVDDDLLYQVLVALRNIISRFIGDPDSEMLVAVVSSLTKMMEKLPTASRYGLQLFWLAMGLVRLVPLGLFNCAASFLEAVLLNINTTGELKNGRMVQVLLQGRLPVEDPASALDESYGIHFNVENFHFSVCASMVKGLTDTVTKSTTIRVLSTFLKVASASSSGDRKFPEELSFLPYLGLVMSRAITSEEAKENLWLAGVVPSTTPLDILAMIDLNTVKDKELLLNAAICIVDFRYLEDSVQNRCLLWLNKVASKRPTVMLHLSAPVFGVLDEVLLSCQNAATLETAHLLLRTLTSNPKLSGGVDTAMLLEEVLEDIGFGGLWRSSTFHAEGEEDRHRTALTERLVELIIA